MSLVKKAAFEVEGEVEKPACQNSCVRRTVKYSYMITSLTTVVVAALFTSYLFAYPFRSNVCNGLSGETTLSGDVDLADHGGIAARCKNQITARGYKDTNLLVSGGLLPASWAKNVAAAGDPADYELCEWNSATKECLEAEPDDAKCASEKDDDGKRKNRWGDDGECEALKAPEICRQTGFKDASSSEKREELASVGAAAEFSGIILLVTLILGVLQMLNYHWEIIGGLCGANKLCPAFGKPLGLDIGKILCGNCMKFKFCRHCAKPNLPDDDIEDDSPGFMVPHEASTIFLSFTVHNVLIIIFGQVGINAKAHIDDECYGVENKDNCGTAGNPDCVYQDADGKSISAEDFIKLGGDGNLGDAKAYYDQRGSIFTVAMIFWWIQLISCGIQVVSFLLSHGNSADMEMVAIRSLDDLNPFKNIGANDNNEIGAPGDYSAVSKAEEFPTRRRVQLRGQF